MPVVVDIPVVSANSDIPINVVITHSGEMLLGMGLSTAELFSVLSIFNYRFDSALVEPEAAGFAIEGALP
jgi:hypothetical protein